MKKRYSLIILSMLIILTGCTSKSSFSTTFDEFTMKFYDNKKPYIAFVSDTNLIGMKVLTEMKEKTLSTDTWFTNSLLIVKIAIQSWTSMKELVDSNTKSLQLKLLKYTTTNNANKKVKCDDLQYSWYITAFSYQLENEILYDGQYFFTDDESLYLISLSSDDPKDIKSFIKSIGTIKCIK